MTTIVDKDKSSIVIGSGDDRIAINLKQLTTP
ncbi:unnamed protein product, partial [Rotaria sp. Silwood2]